MVRGVFRDLCAIVLCLVCTFSYAQPYPHKPLRWIVGIAGAAPPTSPRASWLNA